MAKVKIQEGGKGKWLTARDYIAPELYDGLTQDEKDSQINIRVAGTADTLQLIEVKMPPFSKSEVHAHEQDEVMYVVAGSMKLGAKFVGPGTSIFIQGHTFYAFEAGEEGVQFLNFRPRDDKTYLYPPEATPKAK